MLSGFLESGNVHVADAGLDHEVEVDAVARNLVADDGELEGMIGAFAQHGDADGGALRSLEQIGYVGGAHIVGGLAVDGGDDVAGADAGAIGRGADEGSDHDDLVIARADRHAYAVILAALLFAQRGVRLGIEKVRVGVELVQHARDGAVINRLVGIHRVGIVLLDLFIDFSELLEAVADVGVAAGRGCRADSLSKQHSQQTKQTEHENNQEERTTRTTGHVSKSSGRDVKTPVTPSERSITCESASLVGCKNRPGVTVG